MPHNILIVDDSPIIRRMIAKALRMAEVPVAELREAGNGQEALDTLEQFQADIIFSDINMPVMNGVEMIHAMAGKGVLKSSSVIVISTDRSAVKKEDLQACGVKGYLQKPFTPEKLQEILNPILEKSPCP